MTPGQNANDATELDSSSATAFDGAMETQAGVEHVDPLGKCHVPVVAGVAPPYPLKLASSFAVKTSTDRQICKTPTTNMT